MVTEQLDELFSWQPLEQNKAEGNEKNTPYFQCLQHIPNKKGNEYPPIIGGQEIIRARDKFIRSLNLLERKKIINSNKLIIFEITDNLKQSYTKPKASYMWLAYDRNTFYSILDSDDFFQQIKPVFIWSKYPNQEIKQYQSNQYNQNEHFHLNGNNLIHSFWGQLNLSPIYDTLKSLLIKDLVPLGDIYVENYYHINKQEICVVGDLDLSGFLGITSNIISSRWVLYKANHFMPAEGHAQLILGDILKDFFNIPYQITKITGNLIVNGLGLTSFAGGPEVVVGDVRASCNRLPSLIHFPSFIGGGCFVNHNDLTNLDHCPITIGKTLNCSYNLLTTISTKNNGPRYVGRHFIAHHNFLPYPNLNFIIGGDIILNNNRLTSTQGLPNHVWGDLILTDNPFSELKGLSSIVMGYLGLNSYHLETSKLETYVNKENVNFEIHGQIIFVGKKIKLDQSLGEDTWLDNDWCSADHYWSHIYYPRTKIFNQLKVRPNIELKFNTPNDNSGVWPPQGVWPENNGLAQKDLNKILNYVNEEEDDTPIDPALFFEIRY